MEVIGDSSSFERSLARSAAAADTFGGKMQNIGSRITSVGKRLTLGVTTPLVAAGVASFKMAEDFETSMSRVIGLAGQSEEQVGRWSKQLLVLGPRLGKSPRELAEALYFVASSGVSTGKALDVVTKAAKASSAGLGDTQQVADALTSVMNAYGESSMSAARATDVLVATVREGKGEAADFAPVIGNVTSFASQLGVSFEEVGAALASMTRLGVDAATASTQLQGVFSNLVRPTKQVKDALSELGLTQEQVVQSLQSRGLLATLQMLKERADGNTKALIPLFGNIRALRGVFALVGSQASVVADVFERMGDSTGSLAIAFEESTKRTGFTMEKFRASVEAMGIAIGTILAPIVERVAVFLTKLSLAFQNLDPQTQKLIITAAAVAAALGPVLIIVGSLIGAIGSLIPVFAALASPMGLVVVALAALALAFAAAVLWPDKLQAALQRMGLSAKDSKATVDALRNAFTAIKAVVDAVWPAIQATIVPALRVIQGLLMIVSGILRGDFSEAWKGIKMVVANEIRFVLAILTGFPRVVLGVARQIGAAILQGIGDGLRALPGVVKTGLQGIASAIAAVAAQAPGWAAAIGRAIVSGILSGMGDLLSAVKDKIIGGVQGAIDGAMGVFGHSPQEMIGVALVDGIVKGWNEKSKGISNAMVDGVNEAIDAAQAAIVSAQGVFASAFDSLVSAALAAFDRISSEFETKTEAKIRKQDERRAAAERQRALTEAQAELTVAVEGGDPEAIKAAEQAVQDALFAIQRAADERKAEQERRQFEASRERRRVNFENQLEQLRQSFLNQEITAAQFHNRLIALFKKFEIPFNKAANKLGMALAHGLRQAFGDVERAARALAQTIVDRLSEITVRVHVELQDPKGPGADNRQHGGPVKKGQPYIVGEAGPELFIPGMSGRIAPNGSAAMSPVVGGAVNVFVYGDVTGEEIVQKVREGLLRVNLFNPGNPVAR